MNVQGISNNNIAQALQKPQNEPVKEPTDNASYANNKAPEIPENDEYVPEKPTIGIYNVMNDENSSPKLQFNAPHKNSKLDEPISQPTDKDQKAGKPEDSNQNRKTEKTTANTDKADREIKRLKQKKAQLEKQIQSSDDPNKINELKKKLAQIKNELQQKDNDAYRRRLTTFN